MSAEDNSEVRAKFRAFLAAQNILIREEAKNGVRIYKVIDQRREKPVEIPFETYGGALGYGSASLIGKL